MNLKHLRYLLVAGLVAIGTLSMVVSTEFAGTPSYVLAQEVKPAATTDVAVVPSPAATVVAVDEDDLAFGDWLYLKLAPYLKVILDAVLTAAAGWIAYAFQRWTGHKIEEKHMVT